MKLPMLDRIRHSRVPTVCFGMALVLVLTGNLAAQQLSKIGEVVLSSADRVNGLTQFGTTVICSMMNSGQQVAVDVGNPAAPTVCHRFDPSFGDQWHDPLYVDGVVFTGHRWGGLNMLDVSRACSSGIFQGPLDNTNYHFKGLAAWQDSATAERYLYYSETQTSGAAGGLILYRFQTGSSLSLTRVGEFVQQDHDGGALAVTSDGNWCFQLDPGARSPGVPSGQVSLAVYDTSNKNAPFLLPGAPFDLGLTQVRVTRFDLVLRSDDRYLFGGFGREGLRVIDVSIPANPVLLHTLFKNTYSVESIALAGRGVLLAIVRDSNAGIDRLFAVNIRNPRNPKVVGSIAMDMLVRDMHLDLSTGRIYLVGDGSQGEALLQIWR